MTMSCFAHIPSVELTEKHLPDLKTLTKWQIMVTDVKQNLLPTTAGLFDVTVKNNNLHHLISRQDDVPEHNSQQLDDTLEHQKIGHDRPQHVGSWHAIWHEIHCMIGRNMLMSMSSLVPADAARKIAVLWNIKMMRPTTDCSYSLRKVGQQYLLGSNKHWNTWSACDSCIRFLCVVFQRCKGFGKGASHSDCPYQGLFVRVRHEIPRGNLLTLT
jgi:hypothetical protein